MISVRAFWKHDGKPAKNVKVGLVFNWTHTSDQYTNSSGEVHFDASPSQGKVYANGDVVYEGYLEGMVTVYVD